MKKTLALAAIALAGLTSANAQLLITQYYEGPSTNKWIEITNVSGSSVDLSTYIVGQWNNANAEGYKIDTAASFTMTLTGSLAAGESILLGNTGNATPGYALTYTPRINNNSVINFNGNDSIALYTGAVFATANIVDAIGFTTAGNEGVDKSFVRLTTGVGWNTTSGSDVLDFASVWQNTTLATVDGAATSTDPRLGYSSLTTVPEPTSTVLAAVGLAGVLAFRRRSKILA